MVGGVLQLESCFGVEKQEIALEIDGSEVVVGAVTHMIHLAQLHVGKHTSAGSIVFSIGHAAIELHKSIDIGFVADTAVVLAWGILLGCGQGQNLRYLSEMVSVVLVGTQSKQPTVFILFNAMVQIQSNEVVAQPTTSHKVRRGKKYCYIGIARHANGGDVVFGEGIAIAKLLEIARAEGMV